jgi:hypothetical protein
MGIIQKTSNNIATYMKTSTDAETEEKPPLVACLMYQYTNNRNL